MVSTYSSASADEIPDPVEADHGEQPAAREFAIADREPARVAARELTVRGHGEARPDRGTLRDAPRRTCREPGQGSARETANSSFVASGVGIIESKSCATEIVGNTGER